MRPELSFQKLVYSVDFEGSSILTARVIRDLTLTVLSRFVRMRSLRWVIFFCSQIEVQLSCLVQLYEIIETVVIHLRSTEFEKESDVLEPLAYRVTKLKLKFLNVSGFLPASNFH